MANLVALLGRLLVAVVAFRLARALLHRLAVRAGFCRYHSPLLYTTGLGRRREIHLGTTADFLLRGNARRRLRALSPPTR